VTAHSALESVEIKSSKVGMVDLKWRIGFDELSVCFLIGHLVLVCKVVVMLGTKVNYDPKCELYTRLVPLVARGLIV